MHDNPVNQEINQQNLSQSAIDHLDQRIVRALETVPDLHIPADFATRVASHLPASRPVSLTPTHYGQNAMLIGMVATLAVLLILAVHATGHATLGLLESLLFAEFVVLAVWLSVWRPSLR
jgi:hypothetical protein